MRIVAGFVLIAQACSGSTPENSSSMPGKDDTGEAPNKDTDEGSETGEDTKGSEDSATTPEDCSDGVDNDGDGLTDCEDEDCVDLCDEDCDDGLDNDGDALIDCDDDECFGDEDCPGRYSLSLVTDLVEVRLATGSIIEAELSYGAFLVAHGSLRVEATPLSSKNSFFSCTGQVQMGPPAWIDGGFDGLRWEEKSCDECSYQFQMAPSVSGGSLTWDEACPVESLPSISLGAAHGWDQLTRHQDEEWIPWYTGGAVETTDALPDLYYTAIGSLNQVQAVEWTATYGISGSSE